MRIPVWITIVIAALVIVFGIHRIRISRRTDEQEAEEGTRRRGLYGMSKRAHLVIGILYLCLGGALLATGAFGWNPFGNLFAGKTQPPTKETAPTKGPVPIDQLPEKK